MIVNKLPNSIRRLIRFEKARIRRDTLDKKDEIRLIGELMAKYRR